MSEWIADPYVAARFWVKVEDTGYCWHWTGSTNRHGYGTFKINGRPELAPRVAYTLTRGGIESDCVLHRCDNPICVNPDHLFSGTHHDNMMDMDRKGRRYLGKTSKHKGVSWRNDSKRWRAQIRHNGRMYRLGCFVDEMDAVRAIEEFQAEQDK